MKWQSPIARADELKYRLGVSDMVLASAAYDNRQLCLAAERLEKCRLANTGGSGTT